jgi:hypothetical protein
MIARSPEKSPAFSVELLVTVGIRTMLPP